MQPRSKESEKTLEGVWSDVEQIKDILRRRVSFGHPNHPVDPTDTTRAGSTDLVHNGLLDNIYGSWVEGLWTTRLVGFTCWHNLNQPLIGTELNVRWVQFGSSHDGAGANPTITPVSLYKHDLAVITENSIALHVAAGPGVFIDANHPYRITLFFIPAVRG